MREHKIVETLLGARTKSKKARLRHQILDETEKALVKQTIQHLHHHVAANIYDATKKARISSNCRTIESLER